MEKPKSDQTKLSIVVDKRHGTTYCINSNGRSYIKNNKIFKGEKKT
ncbi:MAG: hypothetical protein J6U23_05045 [Clostridiales bacterium]|nr:hypothetical protein [Clostridiales bacterium]